MKKNIPLTEKERKIILELYKVIDCLPSDMLWIFEDGLLRMMNDYYYRKQIGFGVFPKAPTLSPVMKFMWSNTVEGFAFWGECYSLYREHCKRYRLREYTK